MVAELKAGTYFGGFRIVGELGVGGAATVYRATDPVLRRDVALKVARVRGAAPAMRLGVLREARLLSALTHPHVVKVLAAGVDRSSEWMALELLDDFAPSLAIEDKVPDRRMLMHVLRSVGSALDFTHRRGFAHCDVKPQNILLDPHGHIRLADFDMACALRQPRVIADHDPVVGTPSYMAPEQAMRLAVTHRADLYSLAVVAYRGLCGRLPFEGAFAIDRMLAHASAPMPEGPLRQRGVPEAAIDALRVGLAKSPWNRWPNAHRFVAALGSALGISPSVVPERPEPAPAWHSRLADRARRLIGYASP
jgi:serine/threonine-protein kinase